MECIRLMRGGVVLNSPGARYFFYEFCRERYSYRPNSMTYGARRFYAAFTRALNNPYPEPKQPNSLDFLLKIHSNVVLPFTPRPS